MSDINLLTKVRTNMLLDHPFLGQLATSLNLKFDDEVDTAYTNGVDIGVNQSYFNKLLHKERTGLVAHETFHVMLLHHVRRKPWMDAKLYQIAIDIVVNGLCLENRFTLPSDGILPETWEGGVEEFYKLSKMTVEQVYRYLEVQKRKNPEKHQQDVKGNSTGECRDHPVMSGGDSEGSSGKAGQHEVEQAVKMEEQKMKTRIAQAFQAAKRAGDMSAGMERFVQDILQPKIKWTQRIAREISSRSKTKHVWPPFNRRYLHQDIYLHSMQGESIGNVIWATDTSGSVDQPTLDEINSELRGLARSYEGEFTCLSVDSKVCKAETFQSDRFPKKVVWDGGGGTNFRPAFNWVRDNYKKKVSVMIYATDGWCSRFPNKPPPYPVFWVVWDHVDFVPPFGEVLYVD